MLLEPRVPCLIPVEAPETASKVEENETNEEFYDPDEAENLVYSAHLGRYVLENTDEAGSLKLQANELFKAGDFTEAYRLYSGALDCCPESNRELASVLFANRAAVSMQRDDMDGAVTDLGEAITLNPSYSKAYLRRMRVHMQRKKWVEAQQDLNQAIDLDPAVAISHREVKKLVDNEAHLQFEADKAEMMDKLKGFGNWALGKVGLSMDNFEVQQDPQTGSYNIQFNQNK
ncbi:MAG: hypothetical protein KVP17_001288 [Porospora cf. gigantea B]|uniref:uncharacterized protein n=1 Tax=Porospora cf. gigantea B TaxID=2853592 RepID=UPI003571BB1E|nr:MAG: hypothetical protein KVP17_001288 [Porospora cf. gigantea B]